MPDGRRIIVGSVYVADPTGPYTKPSIVNEQTALPPPSNLDAANKRPR